MKIPLPRNSYQSRSLPFSAQRLVNLFWEAGAEGTKSAGIIFGAPGIKAFADGFSGALRGAHLMDDVLYVVAGDKFYSVASTGTETLIGTINTSIGNVSMASNQATPRELCFVDGTDGWTYDTSNGLREITDAAFVPADTVAFIDGYFAFNRSGTGQFFISALNDGRSYDATERANAEASPDNVVAVFADHRELWVFGQTTIEVFYNSGATDFPLERSSAAPIERGLGAAFAIAADDNTLFWLGDDRIVYRAAGFTPQRVSTHAIEDALEEMSSVSDAVAFFATFSGHKFYHIVFPTGGKAFVLDVATQRWHERESFGQAHWRAGVHVKAFGKQLVGDPFQGRIGELDMDTFDEYGAFMQGIMTFPPVHSEEKRVRHNTLELDFEAGVGLTSGATPQMWLDWSDDGGHIFSNIKPIQSMGKIGQYRQRARWNRLGSARERVYRLTTSDAVKRSFLAAYLNNPRVGNS